MAGGDLQRTLVGFVAGGIVGFFVGYAATYDSANGAGPVAVSAADAASTSGTRVDITPVRKLDPRPFKGAETPLVIIHEVSDFQ